MSNRMTTEEQLEREAWRTVWSRHFTCYNGDLHGLEAVRRGAAGGWPRAEYLLEQFTAELVALKLRS